LLPSGPGGIQQELVVKDLPAAKIQKKMEITIMLTGLFTTGLPGRMQIAMIPCACFISQAFHPIYLQKIIK